MPKAAQKSPELSIDLLQKDTSTASSSVAIHWVLTIGRYLVIVTEIIALATFLLGVYLSKEKNDLKDSIKDRQRQVQSFQNCESNNELDFCEDRFRKIQAQINLVASIRASQFENNKVLSEFARLSPINLSLDKLSTDGKTINFSGSFPDPQQLQTMINSFNTSGKISNLDITALSKDKDSLFKFSATTTINRTAFASSGN
jgi:hypothetical protein